VTKKLDVQTGTKAEAFAFANFDEPRGAGSQRADIGSLRHEEDLVERGRWKAGKEILDFC